MNNLMMHCIQAMCGLLAAFVLIFVSPASAETKVFYSHNDQIGTPQLLTDKDQTVVWQIKYQPFGEDEVVEQDADGNGVAVNMPLRFPGQYYDSESGLHYNYFRDYDPATGRYVQSDPIGLDGGINTYAYVDGNPLIYIDPYGLTPEGAAAGAIIGGTIGAIGGAILGAGGGTLVAPGVGTVGGGWVGAGQGLVDGAMVGGYIGDKVGDLLSPGDMMVAPGNVKDSQIVRDYGEAASKARQCGGEPPDRCKWLEENKGNYRPDQVKATQKAWGCKRSRAGR